MSRKRRPVPRRRRPRRPARRPAARGERDTAPAQLNRIVDLVAELSRRSRQGQSPATLATLAERHGTTVGQIEADLRTLTALGESVDTEWLLSLSVSQQEDRVEMSSGGPFRRPIRFTRDEVVALQLGLVAEARAGDLSRRVAEVARTPVAAPTGDGVPYAVAAGAAGEAHVTDLMLRALGERRRVAIDYAGEGARAATARVVHPHQVVVSHGKTYVVAWCERARGWRHFRADRVIDARLAEGVFAPRPDFAPIEDPASVFRAGEGKAEDVEVRFSPRIARWLAERHPDARPAADGSLTVTHRVANMDWLVGRVLQYGAEAEVVRPEAYREAMRRAVRPEGP